MCYTERGTQTLAMDEVGMLLPTRGLTGLGCDGILALIVSGSVDGCVLDDRRMAKSLNLRGGQSMVVDGDPNDTVQWRFVVD